MADISDITPATPISGDNAGQAYKELNDFKASVVGSFPFFTAGQAIVNKTGAEINQGVDDGIAALPIANAAQTTANAAMPVDGGTFTGFMGFDAGLVTGTGGTGTGVNITNTGTVAASGTMSADLILSNTTVTGTNVLANNEVRLAALEAAVVLPNEYASAIVDNVNHGGISAGVKIQLLSKTISSSGITVDVANERIINTSGRSLNLFCSATFSGIVSSQGNYYVSWYVDGVAQQNVNIDVLMETQTGQVRIEFNPQNIITVADNSYIELFISGALTETFWQVRGTISAIEVG